MAAIRISCSTKDYLPLDSLVEFQGDLKSLSDENYQKLKSEILQTGFAFPIYVWQSQDGINYILGGHQRTRTLRKLQKEGHEIPLIPCVLIEADNVKQAKRRIIQDVSQYGHVEKDGLYEFMNGESELSLDDLKNSFDLPGIDLDAFSIEYLEDNTVPPGEDDENIEPPVEPKSKLGDLWKLGNHRLLCGDSTMIDHVERLMNGKKADMVFTDPPYGVSYQSGMRDKGSRFDIIHNDNVFLSEWINVVPLISSGWIFVWTSWKVVSKWIEITAPLGNMTNFIIWNKGGGGIGDLEGTFSSDFEIALVFNRGAKITGKRIGSVWDIKRDSPESYSHPTQKPVQLGVMAIDNCTNHKDKVLDLFGGSGSTLIACEQTKRHCYMMELEPKYIDVILNRWSKLTGKDPVRDDGVKWSELNG